MSRSDGPVNAGEVPKGPVYAAALQGFGQLDLSSVYRVALLHQRGARFEVPSSTSVKGEPALALHVSSPRSQMHFGRVRVTDDVDLFVNGSGLVIGILRTYYDDQPFRHSIGHTFSDYRQTTAGVLLPYRIETYFKGRLTETIQVSDYRFDVEAPPELFQPRRAK